jgi:hypothetical protein
VEKCGLVKYPGKGIIQNKIFKVKLGIVFPKLADFILRTTNTSPLWII